MVCKHTIMEPIEVQDPQNVLSYILFCYKCRSVAFWKLRGESKLRTFDPYENGKIPEPSLEVIKEFK